MLDGTVYPGHGMYDKDEKAYIMPLWGQLLYLDPEGKVKCDTCRWEGKMPMLSDGDVRPGIFGEMDSFHWELTPDGGEVRGEMRLQELTDTVSQMPVLTGVEVGEMAKKDPNRPSLILRRAGKDSLWDMAKATGSTVEAIREANGLQGEPGENQMLLIPVP